MVQAQTSISDVSYYKQSCLNAFVDEKNFDKFRQDRNITYVIETVHKEYGQKYLDCVKSNIGDFRIHDLVDAIKKNDTVGNPLVYDYDDFGPMAPTSIRYARVLTDLVRLFGNLDGKSIIEIGGGYGGQASIVKQLFDVKEYCIVDLYETLLLAQKYTNRLGFNDIVFEMFQNVILNTYKYDIVISNYAYSEVGGDLQKMYFDNIIRHCKNGYFILNFMENNGYSPKELMSGIMKSMNPQVLVEDPKISPQDMIVYF